MAKFKLTSGEIEKVKAIINRLETTPILSLSSIDEDYWEYRENRARNFFSGRESWGEASADLEIYSLSQADFFANLHITDNDISIQVDRFNYQLDLWFKYGESHAPYWPWRIIMILTKSGNIELELDFLAAYCRHFHENARRGSTTNEKIVQRAIKKGAWDYWV